MAIAMDIDNSKIPRKVIATTLWRTKGEEQALNWLNQKIIVDRSPLWKLEEAFAALEIAEQSENTMRFLSHRFNYKDPERLDGMPTIHNEISNRRKELRFKMDELRKELSELEELEKKIME